MRKVAVLAALVTAFVTALTISPAASPATGGGVATATPALAGTQTVGTAQITYKVTKFVANRGHLFAKGEVLATVRTADGVHTAKKSFQTRVVKSSINGARKPLAAAAVCDVLNLTLAPLRLELLGLIIELDQVVLTIKADSEGGLLGQLLCPGIAGKPRLGTPKVAAALTRKAQTSGLAGGKVTTPAQNLTAQALPPVPAGVCTVLDLVLGPLHLELLGLIVDLNQVHLRITADPQGGLLGQLLCPGIAGQPAGG